MNNQKLTLSDIAEFTWMFGHVFFLETEKGNFIWSDPEYGGDNTIVAYNGSYGDYCNSGNTPYGRDKGKHVIGEYCGNSVEIKQ